MTPQQSERRIEPSTGIIWEKVDEKGSIVTIRPLGVSMERTISSGTWITWSRHEWADAQPVKP